MTAVACEADSPACHVRSRGAVAALSDASLGDKFQSFLESFPANKVLRSLIGGVGVDSADESLLPMLSQGFKCRADDVFHSLAVERVLTCLPMPEFGGAQLLRRDEVFLSLYVLRSCRMYRSARSSFIEDIPSQVALLLERLDVNRDGVISVKELRTWLNA